MPVLTRKWRRPYKAVRVSHRGWRAFVHAVLQGCACRPWLGHQALPAIPLQHGAQARPIRGHGRRARAVATQDAKLNVLTEPERALAAKGKKVIDSVVQGGFYFDAPTVENNQHGKPSTSARNNPPENAGSGTGSLRQDGARGNAGSVSGRSRAGVGKRDSGRGGESQDAGGQGGQEPSGHSGDNESSAIADAGGGDQRARISHELKHESKGLPLAGRSQVSARLSRGGCDNGVGASNTYFLGQNNSLNSGMLATNASFSGQILDARYGSGKRTAKFSNRCRESNTCP